MVQLRIVPTLLAIEGELPEDRLELGLQGTDRRLVDVGPGVLARLVELLPEVSLGRGRGLLVASELLRRSPRRHQGLALGAGLPLVVGDLPERARDSRVVCRETA